jgi:conserved oligomeric Golgi complex subunit 2
VVGSVGTVNKMGGDVEDGDYSEDGFESDGSDEEEDEEEEEEAKFVSSSPAKLAALAGEYVVTERIAETLGRDLPFVRKMEERMTRCRNTILLDLSTALKEARKAGGKGQGRIIKYLGIYRTLDAQADAVKVLKAK